jgi:hypothetical protein
MDPRGSYLTDIRIDSRPAASDRQYPVPPVDIGAYLSSILPKTGISSVWNITYRQ